MAKRKLKPDTVNRYLSLIDPDNTGFSVDLLNDEDTDAATDKQPQGGINNLARSLAERDRAGDIAGMAGGSVTSPDDTSTFDISKSSPRFNINLQPGGQAARINPLLLGNADIGNIARFNLGDITSPDDGASTTPGVTSQSAGVPTARETALSITPEEKLLATLANTNPTPNSFFKRLLLGLTQGAGRVTPEDSPGGAFGKVVGTAVARSFPGVDSAIQYNENVARAKERYSVESAVAKNRLDKRRVESDIAEKEADRKDRETQRKLTLFNQQEQRREKMLFDAARLRDDKRADAQLILSALKELAEDSPKRDELADELQRKYNVNVDRSYGLNVKPPVEKEVTEDAIRKQATSEVMSQIGASVEKIARDSTNNKPHIIAARADLDRVLNDPKSTNMKKAQAREQFQKLYDAELKVNLDYTESDVENKIRQREQELRKEASTTRQSRGKTKGSNTVPASNEANRRNFAQPGQVIKKR